MKRIALAAIAALMVAANGAPAGAQTVRGPASFVAVSTFNPSGNGTLAFSFFNHSSAEQVRIKRIWLSNATEQSVTGGLIPFKIRIASAVTDGGTVQVSSYTVGGGASGFPDNVVMSTGPVGPVYEAKGDGQLPVVRHCHVNSDEAATSDLTNLCYDSRTSERAIILFAGAERGIVVEQGILASDITTGKIMAHVEFTTERLD